MSYYDTEGVVCSRFKLGDSDRILHIYSKNGLIRAVAKGVRKPKSKMTGRLEPFCRVRILASKGRNLDIVSQVELLDPHIESRQSLPAIIVGSAAAALVERLAQHEATPGELYPLLCDFLAELDEISSGPPQNLKESLLLLLSAFELHVAALLGQLSSMEECVRCGSALGFRGSKSLHFDPTLAGIICGKCAGSLDAGETDALVRLSPVAAGILLVLSKRPISQIQQIKPTRSQLAEIREANTRLIAYHFDLNLKSYRYMRRYLS